MLKEYMDSKLSKQMDEFNCLSKNNSLNSNTNDQKEKAKNKNLSE